MNSTATAGWTGAKDRPDSQGSEDLIFAAVHGLKTPIGSIVEPAEMQHAMQGIQQHFILDSYPVQSGLATCFRHANRYLTSGYPSAGIGLQFEGEHVGRADDPEKLVVQFRHLPVPNQRD